MVFSSGVGAPRSKPRNRIQESRSRIMNSMRASLRLCCACRISALNIDTGSNGGRPPFDRSPYPSPSTSQPRKYSKATVASSVSSGSPFLLSRSRCSESPKRERCSIALPPNYDRHSESRNPQSREVVAGVQLVDRDATPDAGDHVPQQVAGRDMEEHIVGD